MNLRAKRLRAEALAAVAAYWNKPVACFGNKARWCGQDETDLLDLDHKVSLPDRPNRHNSHYGAQDRAREAIEHPERFQLLCVAHHRKKSLAARDYHAHRCGRRT